MTYVIKKQTGLQIYATAGLSIISTAILLGEVTTRFIEPGDTLAVFLVLAMFWYWTYPFLILLQIVRVMVLIKNKDKRYWQYLGSLLILITCMVFSWEPFGILLNST